MPNVLLTGGAGFIGSSLLRRLVGRGDRVIILDALTYAGHRENLENISGPGTWELVEGDIRQGELTSRLLREHRIESVIHCAAESHVDRSIGSPVNFLETNVMGTYQMLQSALTHWKSLPASSRGAFRYLQISTDEVFGSLGEDGFFNEESPYRPNSPYSATKAAADHLARAWHSTYGLPVITTYCTNNYGPRQNPEKLIPHMITQALSHRELPVYGDGRQVRDWIHVEDHCDGILLALDRGAIGGTYGFGGRAEMDNLSLVQRICRSLDRQKARADSKPHESSIRMVEDRLGHDRRYAIDDSKAEKELGFKRNYDFESGLEKTIQWYLENQQWCRMILNKRK